jgi:hypothetical protein
MVVHSKEEKTSLIDDRDHELQEELSTKSPRRKYLCLTRRELILSTVIISLILFKIFMFKILFLNDKLSPPSDHDRLSTGFTEGPGGVNVTGEMHSGQLTYYAPGLGSCGLWNSQDDYICAISHDLYGTPPPSVSISVLARAGSTVSAVANQHRLPIHAQSK